MTHRPYDEDFKKSIVALYQNGKSQSQLSKEYGVSLSARGKSYPKKSDCHIHATLKQRLSCCAVSSCGRSWGHSFIFVVA